MHLDLAGTHLGSGKNKGSRCVRWSRLPNPPERWLEGGGVIYHSCTLRGPLLFFFGGYGGKKSHRLSSLVSFNLFDSRWCERVVSAPFSSARYMHVAALVPAACGLAFDYLLILGGFISDHHPCTELLAYRFDDDTWHFPRCFL